ncbi:hypothetical protein F5884DRAFT_819672 [Xylogone sp. PMI_703]|nr:hypothetical protein F5884DRAFT_819672 [Xylogone sp. PMI_703]
MAASMVANPYAAQPMPQQQPPYGYVSAPQPPPSPPADETSKCSLPSISSLLGVADGSRPQEQSQQSQGSPQSQASFSKSEYRPSSGHQYGPSPPLSSRGTLPPTPPMQSDSGFDDRQTPPSTASSVSQFPIHAPGYFYETTAPSAIGSVEAQRQASMPQRRVSMPQMGYAQSPFTAPHYNPNPSPHAMNSYYPASVQAPPQPQVSGLYYQRPLPQNFPPPLMPVSVTLTPSSGTNPWQHHHYISPSSAASFPQSQDRYICQTCNKAFSRPSSLRIHSHSHTGEKPFKCPHHGCGKAFSVRSNMKRHERGCHIEGSAGLVM